MVLFAIAFALGIIAAAGEICPGVALPAAVLSLGLALACWEYRPDYVRPLSGAVCLFAAGALLWNARHTERTGDPLARDTADRGGKSRCVIEGRVRLTGLEQITPSYHRFLVDVDTVETPSGRQDLAGGTSVGWTDPNLVVQAGQRVRVRGVASTTIARVNPNTGSYEDYLRRQGIHTSIQARGPGAVTIAETPRWSLVYWMSRLRTAQATSLARVVPAEALPFVQAVWLGYRTTMPDEEYEAYLNSGTVHILSVSGLHMAMIYATASFLVGLYVRRPRTRAILCMAAVAAFTLMSGMRPSALRSAAMVFIYLTAELFDREPDAPTALSESALLLLAINPEILFDGGFQLSFLCVASMLLFSEKIVRGLGFVPTFLREALATSFAVQLLPFPLAIFYFHVFPAMASIANLLLVPVSTLALWLCLVASVCCSFSFPLALLFGQALGVLVALMRITAKILTAPSFSHWYVTSPTATAVVAYYGALGIACWLLWSPPRRRFPRRLFQWSLVTAVILMVVLWNPLSTEPRVVVLDVGQGDAVFAQSKGGHAVLIDTGFRKDTGNGRPIDVAQKTIAPFLWANHITRLDAIALSHAHADHVGGTAYLLEHFDVGQVLIGPASRGSRGEEKLLLACQRRGVPVRTLRRGDAFAVPEMVFSVLHPPAGWNYGNDSNNGSLVLRLDWQGSRILFTGDIEAPAEEALPPEECSSEILKIPHHGSKTSSSPSFIGKVAPTDAIVSTGGADVGEALSQEVMERYRQRGVRVWRTDLLGGIDVTLSESGLTLRGTRSERGYPAPGNEPGSAHPAE